MSAHVRVQYRADLRGVFLVVGAPGASFLLLPGREIFRFHHLSVTGWLGLIVFAVTAGFLLLFLVKPPKLALTTEGFVWTGPLLRHAYRVRWNDIAEVGLWRKKKITLQGERPYGWTYLGFNYKPGHVPTDKARSTAWSEGITGWDGSIPIMFDAEPGAVLEAFRERIGKAQPDGAVERL